MRQTMRSTLCSAVVLLVACMRDAPATVSALALLQSADSAAVWSPDSTVIGDIDCDGLADTAILGRARDEVRVGIVFGSGKAPSITALSVAPAVQTAVPSVNVRLAREGLDYDPSSIEEGPGELEGFQRSTSCIGINLWDGDTDSFHMYWNHVRSELHWWRR